MGERKEAWSLGELAQVIGADLRGPADLVVRRPVPAGSDDPEGITFASNEKYLAKALESSVGVILVPHETPSLERPVLGVLNPRAAFGVVLALFEKPSRVAPGIHPTAVVADTAIIHPDAAIGAYAVIEAEAVIDSGVQVFSFAYIGARCSLGAGAKIYPHAVLVQDVSVGPNSIVHSGAVIGGDGFGFAWTGSEHVKVPQVGQVIIGENVEIGANTCIDRATCGETVISNGVKIDNQVQVAHNVELGEHTVLAAQVGVAGSTVVGRRVMMGGQVGVKDHLVIGDDTQFGGGSIVLSDTSGGEHLGYPAKPSRLALKSMIATSKLPDLQQRIRQMEKDIEELKRAASDAQIEG